MKGKCFVCKKQTNDIKITYDFYDKENQHYESKTIYFCRWCYNDCRESLEYYIHFREVNQYSNLDNTENSNTTLDFDYMQNKSVEVYKLKKKINAIPSMPWGKRQKLGKITDDEILDFYMFLKKIKKSKEVFDDRK